MKSKKIEKRLIVLGVSILLLLVIIGFTFLKPKFTGFVIGPSGEQCDGEWVCADWGGCTDGNQTRACTSNNSLNCTSPVTEFQSCLLVCEENWTCADWGGCTDGNQTRVCEDVNVCGTEDNKPELLQSCTDECAEDWNCTEWTECADSSQTRTCTDSASCGTNISKPEESQSCTVEIPCTEDWSCPSWDTIECISEVKTRTCEDTNSCGTTDNKPSVSKDCSAETSSTETASTAEDSSITSSVTEEITSCSPDWQCGGWSECADSSQTRTCEDTNVCGTEEGKPGLSQSCEIVIEETCFDEIQNQDEEGVDCGGVCEKKCSVFTIVGSVISGPIDSGRQFFQKNKTISFIILGVMVLGVAGLVTFRAWKKKKNN